MEITIWYSSPRGHHYSCYPMVVGHSKHGFSDTGDHNMRNMTPLKFKSNSEIFDFIAVLCLIQVHSYLLMYSLLVVGTICVANTSHLVYIFGSIRASKKISTLLVESILSSTLRWALAFEAALFHIFIFWTCETQVARWDPNVEDDSQMYSRHTRRWRPDRTSILYLDLCYCIDA